MNIKPMLACIIAASLAGPTLVIAGEADADSSSPTQFVKDSAITAAVKTRLAANHLASLTQLKVDTDRNGVVWLSGTTQTQEAADRAVEIARTTDGVVEVKSTIEVTRAAR
jgi:hyperosmotically inducible periplasmic protein